MEKIVVALYDRFEDASAAVTDLVKNGIAKDKIALLANNAGGDHPGVLSNPAFAESELSDSEDSSDPRIVAAEIGAGVGGVLGLLVGMGAIAVPGIGPVIAAGWWIPMLAAAAVGAGVGGGIGVLTDHGVEEADAHLYAEGLRRGGTLVTAHAADKMVDTVAKLFKAHGAVDIEKRGAYWQAEGWVSFDVEAQPLSAAEVEAMRLRQAEAGHESMHPEAIRHYFDPAPETQPVGGASTVTTHYAEDEMRR